MGRNQISKSRKQIPGGEMPSGPAGLRSRPKGPEDHAVVDTETVKAPLLHSWLLTSHRKHSPAGPIIIAANTNELGSNDCPDVVEVIWGMESQQYGAARARLGGGDWTPLIPLFCSR